MSKRKRISFTVINGLIFDQRMQKICNSLSYDGYDVILIGRKIDGSPLLDKVNYETKSIKCFINKGKMFYLEYNLRVFFALLSTKTDVLSAVDCDTLWANYLVAKIKRKPLVFDAHELFSQVPEVINRPRVQKFWQFTERFLIPKTDYRYTVSKSIADYYEKKHKVPFGVVRNAPLYKEMIPFNQLEIGPYILYQGALNEGRGLEDLITAMQQIEINLVLIGEGDISQKLKNMVTDLKLENKVIFLGYLPPSEMSKYTVSATIGINVSENKGLSYYYSLNNKFFDYIHAGLPSIINNFPEYKELNDKYEVGLLCEPSVEDLVEKINYLLMDPEYYGKLKENCLDTRRYLNWQEEEKQLFKIYDSIK